VPEVARGATSRNTWRASKIWNAALYGKSVKSVKKTLHFRGITIIQVDSTISDEKSCIFKKSVKYSLHFSRHATPRHAAKQSKAKQSKAKQSKAKQSKAKQSKAKQSKAKFSKMLQANNLYLSRKKSLPVFFIWIKNCLLNSNQQDKRIKGRGGARNPAEERGLKVLDGTLMRIRL
jgi:hypothetical protein